MDKTKHPIITNLPYHHFGDITGKVLSNLHKGMCSCVYGVPGYGMEYFAKHVDVLLSSKPYLHKTILINASDPTFNQSASIKRYLAGNLGIKKFETQKIKNYLDNFKVTIIIGECFDANHKNLFTILRNLRWLNRENLTLLFVCNYKILSNQAEFLKYDTNMFHPLYLIENFDYAGVKRIIKLNNLEFNWGTAPKYWNSIYKLSGGNPALVKYICMAIYEEGEYLLDNLETLISIEPLRTRLCDIADLFLDLNYAQQIKIGLINKNNEIFSPLVKLYIQKKYDITVGSLFNVLTSKEKVVISHLLRSTEKKISKEAVSVVLGQTLDNYSEWAIYKFMQRLSQKVTPQMIIKCKRKIGWYLDLK